jgi:hypothetical protein
MRLRQLEIGTVTNLAMRLLRWAFLVVIVVVLGWLVRSSATLLGTTKCTTTERAATPAGVRKRIVSEVCE